MLYSRQENSVHPSRQSFWYVCPIQNCVLEYCHIIFQWLGFIRIEQFFTLGLEIDILSFLLFTHGVRISLRQSLLRRKKTARVSRTDLFPSAFLYHTTP